MVHFIKRSRRILKRSPHKNAIAGKMKKLLFLTLLFLWGCTPAGLISNSPVHHVTVNNVPVQVQKMAGSDNDAWAAAKDDFWGGFVDPKDYERNIIAIEKVTGCKVVGNTVTNAGMRTTALVYCTNKKTMR
jgi:hypothetical protein